MVCAGAGPGFPVGMLWLAPRVLFQPPRTRGLRWPAVQNCDRALPSLTCRLLCFSPCTAVQRRHCKAMLGCPNSIATCIKNVSKNGGQRETCD